MRSHLDGRRGWTAVGTLGTTLVLLVAGQLSAGAAAAAGPTPRSATAVSLDELVRLQVAGAEAPSPTVEALAVVDADAALQEQARAAEAARTEADRQEQAAALAAAETAARAEAERQAAAAREAEAAAVRLVPVAATSSTTTSGDPCSGPGWQQRRGEAALASLGPAAGGSGFRVEFAGARSGYMGLAHLQRRVVEIFVRNCGAQSDGLLRHVLAHELGHAYDTMRMSEADRAAYQAARGIPASTPWYGCSGCADFATPAGDFAEVYAQWLRGASSNRSELAGAPGSADLQTLAARFFGG